MVVHFQHASATSAAVVSAIRLLSLTLFAEAHLTRRFHRQGAVRGSWFRGRKRGVSRSGVQWGSRICDYGSGIGPVKEYVESEAEKREKMAC